MILTEPVVAYRAWKQMTTDAMKYFNAREFFTSSKSSNSNYYFFTKETQKTFKEVDYNCLVSPVYLFTPHKPRKMIEAKCYCNTGCIHDCGMYAFKTKDLAITYITAYWPRHQVADFIISKVALWGNVEEHTSGYRGQYGYPQSFYHLEGFLPFEKLKHLADVWAVDIE